MRWAGLRARGGARSKVGGAQGQVGSVWASQSKGKEDWGGVVSSEVDRRVLLRVKGEYACVFKGETL